LKARIALVILVHSHRKIGRCLQLFLGHVSSIALQIKVVVEFVPGQGVVTLPDAEEPLEGDDHKGNLATHLLDDQAFDFADVMTSGIVDCRAFDAVAFDEAPPDTGEGS
jgi:hypothetical protein